MGKNFKGHSKVRTVNNEQRAFSLSLSRSLSPLLSFSNFITIDGNTQYSAGSLFTTKEENEEKEKSQKQ